MSAEEQRDEPGREDESVTGEQEGAPPEQAAREETVEEAAEETGAEKTPVQETAAEGPAAEEAGAQEPPAEEPAAPDAAGQEPPAAEPAVEGAVEAEEAAAPQPVAQESASGEGAQEASQEGPQEDLQEGPQEGPQEGLQEGPPGEAGAEEAPAVAAEQPGEDGAAIPGPRSGPPEPVDLAAEARYSATGKRKSSIARVIVRPGTGAFEVNGRTLVEYFPRRTLQAVARQPLEVTGYLERVDVRVKIHGGGVSSQADAVRHGVARALIEVDPNLRGELKRRQLLTRDARVKERRKAGLKKARKRPQFSKR